MDCEITLNESVGGTSFALKANDKLVVGQDIDEAEAVRWVKGGRARVTKGELPGTEAGAAAAPRMIGTPPPPPAKEEEDAPETIVRHRRKR